jgi:bile acid:Na+ symporter, BASS family
VLQKINRLLERAMPVITPTSLVIGVLLANRLEAYAFLVPWIFAFMTFTGSLSSNFKALTWVISHPFSMFVALFILHIFMPVWAWVLGHVVFSGDMFTITGLFLAAVIPTGITSFIWVSIHKGNIPLALTIILIDTLLSPFVVPYSLSLVAGEEVHMDVWGMMQGLCFMVVLPSLLGMLLNQVTNGKVKEMLGAPLSPFSKVGLAAVVMLNSAVVAPYLSHIDQKLLSIGKWLKRGREEIVVLTFTGGMRNISAGAVLAVSYFPAAVAVPVVLGILFQQVLASFYGYMLQRYDHKPVQDNHVVHGGM